MNKFFENFWFFSKNLFLHMIGISFDVTGIAEDMVSMRMDMLSNVVIPRVTFSIRSPFAVEGENIPMKATMHIMYTGIT